MAHDVFISYENTDRQVADNVCSALESEGIKCWIAPRDVNGEYGEAIIRAINSSTIMIILLSSNANDSRYVFREAELAVKKDKIIYTLRIEDVLPSAKLEFFISSSHWLDMYGGVTDDTLETLIQRIKLRLPSSPGEGEEVTPRHIALAYSCWRKESDGRFNEWDEKYGQRIFRLDLKVVAKGDVKNNIDYVQYFLHPSWRAAGSSSDPKIYDSSSSFQLKELIWGDFFLYAEVHLNNQDVVPLSCFVQIPR